MHHIIGGQKPGQGRYALSEMVGRGGFATVWRARSMAGPGKERRGYLSLFGGARGFRAPREVAVKAIPVYGPKERHRALREGQIASALRHKNIVETLEVIPGDLEVYLVTEFVRGAPLDVAARNYDAGEVVDALAQILEALSYAHSRGVIHRDIKPQNALVDDRGRVKLTDFGVAYRAGDARLTQVGYAVGTPGYIAPEILDGEDPSALTDVYAVGATARTLLSRLPDEPPERLLEFVDRATSPNPAHRPKNAAAALNLLVGRRKKRTVDHAYVVGPPKEREAPAGRRFAGGFLRAANGLMAGWLGYLGAGLFLGASESLAVAVGIGVLCSLLPRLGSLSVVIALAVALARSGQIGFGVAALLPVVGGTWIAAGSAVSRDVARLPLAPLLAAPLASFGLGAGLPLFLGAFMRPVGAALSAAAAALLLVAQGLFFGDGVIPYLGLSVGNLTTFSGPVEFLEKGGEVLGAHPALLLFAALWAAMALLVATAEWLRVWAAGLVLAGGGGLLGYYVLPALAEPGFVARPEAPAEAMTSLGIAAIMYAVVRYLGSLFR